MIISAHHRNICIIVHFTVWLISALHLILGYSCVYLNKNIVTHTCSLGPYSCQYFKLEFYKDFPYRMVQEGRGKISYSFYNKQATWCSRFLRKIINPIVLVLRTNAYLQWWKLPYFIKQLTFPYCFSLKEANSSLICYLIHLCNIHGSVLCLQWSGFPLHLSCLLLW